MQKYISQMLGMARPTTFTDDSGELVVVNQGYGTEEDHRVLEEYEKWLFKNCESLMVERGEYFSCTMRYQAQMKECYYNSLMYSWEDKDAQYYEGWVVSESLSLPIRHAWILNGQVSTLLSMCYGEIEVKRMNALLLWNAYSCGFHSIVHELFKLCRAVSFRLLLYDTW